MCCPCLTRGGDERGGAEASETETSEGRGRKRGGEGGEKRPVAGEGPPHPVSDPVASEGALQRWGFTHVLRMEQARMK